MIVHVNIVVDMKKDEFDKLSESMRNVIESNNFVVPKYMILQNIENDYDMEVWTSVNRINGILQTYPIIFKVW